jgi:hypothetical protein
MGIILAPDFGQAADGNPAAGFLHNPGKFGELGFDESGLRQMICADPARLLGR